MKRILFIIMGFIILSSSCSQGTKNDAGKQVAVPFDMDIHEKNSSDPILIDGDYLQTWNMSLDKELADKDIYKLNAFTRLKDGQNQFTYYILKELNWGDSFKSFLIYEDYESESAVWVANYDKDYKLIDATEVYYENAEGAWGTSSKIDIKQHLIELTQYDAYATPETSVKKIKIEPNGKIL